MNRSILTSLLYYPKPWVGLLIGIALSDPSRIGAASSDSPYPFENEVREFERSDATNPPPKKAILFVGSSSIRMWTNLAASFPNHQIIGRGFGGSQMAQLNHYVGRLVLPYEPSHILVYEGDNDLAAGKTPEQVLQDYREFVERVHEALPNSRISFLAIKPSKARWHLLPQIRETNERLKSFAEKQRRLDYIDTFTPILDGNGNVRLELFKEDGLHLNASGYGVWTEVIRRHL